MPKINESGSVVLSSTVKNGLLEAAESKDSRSSYTKEEDMAQTAEEETTTVVSPDRIGTKVMKPSEGEQMDGGKAMMPCRGE